MTATSDNKGTPASTAVAGAATPETIRISDPHAVVADLQESEVTRVRTLRGVWRWALLIATAATILLCINQQFSLRFFIDYTQLNTEYFYLLIALMLPFTFLIFPGSSKAPLDRIPWYDALLFVLTCAAAIWLMMNIRKAAALGWEFEGAPRNVILARSGDVVRPDGSAAPYRRMESASERTSLYALSAGSPTQSGWAHSGAHSLPLSRQRPITCSRAKACSAFRFRRLRTL